MERTTITFSAENFLTINLMVIIAGVLFAMIAKGLRRNEAG